jgi:hypothetical protein
VVIFDAAASGGRHDVQDETGEHHDNAQRESG